MSPESPGVPKINLYRNISITFVVIVAMLVVALLLIFYSKSTITVNTEPQDINLSFNVEAKDGPELSELLEKDVVAGHLVSYERLKKGEFEVLSTKTVSNGELVGKIRIVNKAGHSQPLLKTTQLQADNGVIVRTSRQVTVPAGGEVLVDVYPKDPTNFVNVEPGDLVIIKLGKNLQDDIYGVVEDTLTSEPREVKILSEGDISRAQDELISLMIGELREDLSLSEKDDIVAEIVSSEVDLEIGDEAVSFNLDLAISLEILEFDQSQLLELLGRKIEGLDLSGVSFGLINLDKLDYSIEDKEFGDSVLVKVNYLIQANLDENHPIFERSNLVGKTIDEIREYFGQYDMIVSTEVNISPYWKKTLPRQASKIKIIVQ